MSPFQFEEFIARLFNKKEYHANATKKTGDSGIDVIATKGLEKVAIQCKKNRKDIKVSNGVIQKALGSLVNPYNATNCIVITTAECFTNQAIQQAGNANIPCELWNRKKLIAEILSTFEDCEEGWDLLNELEENNNSEDYLFDDHIDIDRITTGISNSQRNNIITIKEIASDLEIDVGKTIPIDKIIEVAEGKGINIDVTKETIEKLKRKGDFFEPKKGYLQRI